MKVTDINADETSVPTITGGRSAGGRGLLDGLPRVAGRVLLWLVIVLVGVRGIESIAATPTNHKEAATTANAAGNEVGVFAVRFAEAYLSFTPGQTVAYQQAVSGFLARGLSDQTVLPSSGQGVTVAEAMVAREQSLSGSRAIVTVAVFLSDGQVRYLAVPVAKDKHGGLDVYALPSLVAPPVAGTAAAVATTAVPATDTAAATALARGFLTAYVSGEQGASLSQWLAPGTVLAAMPTGLSLTSTGGLGVISRSAGRLVLQAEADVADSASGAVYALAYRLALTRGRSGWRVAAVAGGPQS